MQLLRRVTFTPIWSHVNKNEKRLSEIQLKFKISQFLEQLWYRPSLGVCINFMVVRRRCLNFLFPCGPKLTKKIRKSEKKKKKIVWRYGG